MAYTYDRVSSSPVQEPPICSELGALFDSLPDEELLKALHGNRRMGRPGHSLKVLWRSSLARYVMGLPSVSSLIRLLQDNPYVAKSCGINCPDEIPSQPTFSRFLTKLSKKKYAHIVKDVMREMVREFYKTIPDFGKVVAIDSTDINAWSNPSKKPFTDPDCSWSVKRTVGPYKKYWLGYKVHLLVDAVYEIPISMTVTTAKVADVHGATRVLSQARFTHSKFRPRYVAADAGYSSDKLRKHIKRQYRAGPIIKPNPAHKKALQREQLPEFQEIYDKRFGIERVFSRLKEHRSLNKVTVQRRAKVTIHCFLSVIVLMGQALATGGRCSVRKVVNSSAFLSSAAYRP